jgi:Transposase
MRDARHHDSHGRARDRRLELITGSKRRRARSARGKAAIVAETFAPGANVPEIARRHGLNRGLLFDSGMADPHSDRGCRRRILLCSRGGHGTSSCKRPGITIGTLARAISVWN